MLKEIFLIFSICSITACKSVSENGIDKLINQNSDTTWVLHLNKFKVDSCLINLFSSISNTDKVGNGNKNKVYSVSIFHDAKYLYLTVRYEYLQNLRFTDYSGFFTINNTDFFCRGDLSQNALFKITGHKNKFDVGKNKASKDNVTFIRDPLLQGTYYGCKGTAIKMEVYTNTPVPDFEMEQVK